MSEKNLNSPIDLPPETPQPASPDMPAGDASEAIDKEWQKMREQEEARAEEEGKTLIRQKHNPLGGEPQYIETREDVSSKPENIAAEREDTAQAEETGMEENKEKPWKQLSAEKLEARKEKVERNRDEKYGVDKSSGKWKILKSGVGMLVNTAGSILGARVAWEAPKLVYNYFKKKGRREKLSDITMHVLKEAQKTRKIKISNEEIVKESEKIYNERRWGVISWESIDNILADNGVQPGSEEADAFMKQWDRDEAIKRLKEKSGFDKTEKWPGKEESGPVFEKIKELNGKLKEVKLPPNEKKDLREKMAQILKEYRLQDKELADVKTEKLGKLLDTYINNKAQALLTAKEALNAASIAIGVPLLRVGVYSAFSAAERWQKIADQYNKDGGKEGESKAKTIAKGMTLGAVKETVHGLTLGAFDKEKKGVIQRGFGFLSSVGTLLRFAGLAEYEYALQSGRMTIQEGAQKLREELAAGNISGALEQAAGNWLNNAERVLGYVGIHLPRESADGAIAPGANYENTREWASERPADILAQQTEDVVEPGHIIPGAPIPMQEAYMPPDTTQDWLDKTSHLAGDNQTEIMKILADDPNLEEKLDDQIIQDLLAKKDLGSEQIKTLLESQKVELVDKSGGSVSEALQKALTHDAKATVVNPDGSILKNFDANLVHKGDTVALDENGEITIFKTSGIAVKEGQSLEDAYQAISSDLNKTGTLSDVSETIAPPVPMPEMDQSHLVNDLGQKNALEILTSSSDNRDADLRAQTEEARKYLNELKESTGLQPREGESVEKYVERSRDFLREQEELKEKLRSTPEALPQNWPPKSGQTGVDRISPNAWSEPTKQGGEFPRYEPLQNSAADEELDYDQKLPEAPETGLPKEEVAAISETPSISHHESAAYSYSDPKIGNFSGKFLYDSSGKITDFRSEGATSLGGNIALRDSVLRGNWHEMIYNKYPGRPDIIRNIEATANNLGVQKKILESIAIDKANTPEYSFLKESMGKTIKLMEQKYGDIFK